MRLFLADKYINGTVAFESQGDYAKMSYIKKPGYSSLPLNAQYEIEGAKWKVVKAVESDFNPSTINVSLEKVNG